MAGQDRRSRSVTEETVDNASAHGVVDDVHRGVDLTADQESHPARMIPDPLHEWIEAVQSGVASHTHDVRPHDATLEFELTREEGAEPRDHEAARRDAHDVVDVRHGQRRSIQCAADCPRPEFERSLTELAV